MITKVQEYPAFEKAIKEEELVYVFGTGISGALTGKSYGWWRWIMDGIHSITDKSISQSLKEELEADDSADNMISVVGKVLAATKLDGTYANWMKESFESNAITNSGLARTLRKLSMANDVFATTNYDLLLEKAAGLSSITYEQPDKAFHMLEYRHANSVLHIHGVYDSKSCTDNIIADRVQYKKVLNDKGAQFIQNILGTRTIIFIGCGKTAEDANIAQFIEFAWHHLKLDNPYFFLQNSSHPVTGLPDNIMMISYGDEYEDLPLFLEEIAQTRLVAKLDAYNLVGRSLYTQSSTDSFGLSEYHFANEYLEFCGRKKELGQLKTFLENDASYLWWAVTGQAGSGKSRLAYELMKCVPHGYTAFFMNPTVDIIQAKSFLPFCDTLIVVDYVLGNEEGIAAVVNALYELFSTDRNHCYKLRFLFLERENSTISGTWYSNLIQAFRYIDRSRFLNAEYRPNPSSHNGDFLYIDDLDDHSVVELIGHVCRKRGLPEDGYRDRSLRDAYANKYEQLRFRPLFLQVFVQAWMDNGQKNADYRSYWDLLNAVIHKEMERLLGYVEGDKQTLASLVQLLVRASISPLDSSILPDQYVEAWNAVKSYVSRISLPGIERKERLISLFNDASHAVNNNYANVIINPQYPDMIKEALFLQYVDDFFVYGAELWQNAPDAYSGFLYRCVVDFPNCLELRAYIRDTTRDATNLPAMRARIALLHHDIISKDDDAKQLLCDVDTEYKYWFSLDDMDETIRMIRLEGLYAGLLQYIGWSKEREAFSAIAHIAMPSDDVALMQKKIAYLLDTAKYFTCREAYSASEKVIRYLEKLLPLCKDAALKEYQHEYNLSVQAEHVINHIGLIKTDCQLGYRDSDWQTADALCDQLEASCDLMSFGDAEIWTYTLLRCTKLAFEKLAGGHICDFAFRLQDYAETGNVAFNDRIHYYYLYSKFIEIESVAVASTLSLDNTEYANHLIDEYINEVSKNEMIRDFSGLLVGAWALKVGYDEEITDTQVIEYISKAQTYLETYPDSEMLAAKYMDLLCTATQYQYHRKVSSSEVEYCYALTLRFPVNKDVLDGFFKLLKESDEVARWFKYIRNKQIVNGLIQNKMTEYLHEPTQIQMPYVRGHHKVGANEPCPCGSGKTFKRCCRGNGRYD